MRCRAGLGQRPTALPAQTAHCVSVVSASFLPVRVAVRDGPFASSKRILWLRRGSADVSYPVALACQDRTDVALEFPSFMVVSPCLFINHSKLSLIESEPHGPNARPHRELPNRILSASAAAATGQRCGAGRLLGPRPRALSHQTPTRCPFHRGCTRHRVRARAHPSVRARPAAAAGERRRGASFVSGLPGPDRRCTGNSARHCCPASLLLHSIKMILIESIQSGLTEPSWAVARAGKALRAG
jgi:hypothetical protein